MSKRIVGAAALVALYAVGAPAAGQEGGRYPTPSAQGANLAGLSYSGCEDLLRAYGAVESVTYATPPQQVLYCLDVVPGVPPAPGEENAPCPDVRSSGTLAACVSPGTARVVNALDSALPGPPPADIIGPDGTGSLPPADATLPDTGGGFPLVPYAAGLLPLLSGSALVRRLL